MTTPINKIQWDTVAESWPYPLSDKHRAVLAVCHACTDDGMISVVAVAPAGERPDLILSLPALDAVIDNLPPSEETDGIAVRFGRMALTDFKNLSEHDGW